MLAAGLEHQALRKQGKYYTTELLFFTAGASGASWTQNLSLRMMRQVFYYCGMADGLESHFLIFSHSVASSGSWT
jgi:hypothetical protein